MLYYDNFKNVPIDEEINNIINTNDPINIKVDTKRKDILFLLGILFAASKRINIVNKEEIVKTEKKSFDNMTMYWHEFNLQPNIPCLNLDHYIFLICPVRNATESQKKDMQDYINMMEANGYKIHYPERDTNQIDSIGYRICTDNANAIGKSSAIHIYYDRNSTGSLFDLGVAYYFQYISNLNNIKRDFVLLNEDTFILNENDFGDSVISQMKKKEIQKTKK